MQISVGINISYFYEEDALMADGGVSIAKNGEVVFAMAEERASGKKYDGGFRTALRQGLDYLGITGEDVDLVGVVGFAEDASADLPPHLEQMVRAEVGTNPVIRYCKSHHAAHAWTAVTQGGSSNALVMVADHTGNILEYSEDRLLDSSCVEQTSYFLWNGVELQLLDRDHDTSGALGYGRFYSKITKYVGFDSYQDSGKMMGLAPFGRPAEFGFPEAYSSVNGSEVSEIDHAAVSDDGLGDFTAWMSSKSNGETVPSANTSGEFRQEHADMSYWAQDVLEKSVIRKLTELLSQHSVETIYVSGGVALNSVMNARIEQTFGLPVFVPSSPGDAGLSLGVLAWAEQEHFGRRLTGQNTPYLGPKYTIESIEAALSQYGEVVRSTIIENVELDAARSIAQNKIIAWFQDRSEFGPRALGNRSLLTSASNAWTKDVMNQLVKNREWFRPLAPAVLSENFHEYFDSKFNDFDFMMKVSEVHDESRSALPAALHVDCTARVQTVRRDLNPKFHSLISYVKEISGTPIVMNTSLNLGGFPLVEGPEDAIRCFLMADGIEALYINNFKVTKI